MQSVLFLDIDGVIAPLRIDVARSHLDKDEDWDWLDPIAVGMLARLIKLTQCKIVISSDWRIYRGWEETDAKANFIAKMKKNKFLAEWLHDDWRTIKIYVHEVADRDPVKLRVMEIKEWLSRHPEVKKFAVIDDMPLDIDNFVKTSPRDGLLYDHYDQLRELLRC